MAMEEQILSIADGGEEERITVEAEGLDIPSMPGAPQRVTPVKPPWKQESPKPPADGVDLPREEPPRATPPPKGKKWLETQKAEDFMPFFMVEMERLDPPHACAGNLSKLERALGQRKKLDGHVSHALRSDYDGVLDVAQVDQLRSRLEQERDQIEAMLDAIGDMKKNKRQQRRRRKRASDERLCDTCDSPLWDDPQLGVPVCVACVSDRDGVAKVAIEVEDLTEEYEPTSSDIEESKEVSPLERQQAAELLLRNLEKFKEMSGIPDDEFKKLLEEKYGPFSEASAASGMMKEAATARVPYFATAFQRAIAGALVNGKVSGGRNIEELYAAAKDKYKIDDREELAIFQILADMGYPTFKDRLRFGDDQDPRRTSDHGEWQSQYYA